MVENEKEEQDWEEVWEKEREVVRKGVRQVQLWVSITEYCINVRYWSERPKYQNSELVLIQRDKSISERIESFHFCFKVTFKSYRQLCKSGLHRRTSVSYEFERTFLLSLNQWFYHSFKSILNFKPVPTYTFLMSLSCSGESSTVSP